MKNTFYRPGQVSSREFDQIIEGMRNDLNELVSGKAGKEEIIEYAAKLIQDAVPLAKNPSMVFWGLDEPQSMPSDSRVLYFYRPSYIAVSILSYIWLNGPEEAKALKGYQEILKKGLLGATGRGFSGSGHDAIKGLIDALDIFTTGEMCPFVMRFPEICPTFTSIFLDVRSILEEKMKRGKVTNGWGEDFTDAAFSVMERMKKLEKGTLIFVYGTLISGNSNHGHYLGESRYLGEEILEGYDLYDLGNYPGIRSSRTGSVRGEVYYVTDETLQRINVLEGEGSLYSLKRETVEMDGNSVPNVGVYVYLHDVDKKNLVSPHNQPWGKKNNKHENLVWYAAYGSNMLEERLMCYLNGTCFRNSMKKSLPCTDPTPPRAKMNYEFPHDMYYGMRSSGWEGKGVSFLDATKPGKAYGVAYLMTKEQFEHIYAMENGGIIPDEGSGWYGRKVMLGTFDDIPVMTVTNHKVVDMNDAGSLYLKVLKEGLMENYPEVFEKSIDEYLLSRNR